MHQSKYYSSNEKYCSSISKLLDHEFSYQSKQSTREQMYDQIFKHKNTLRKDNHNLKRQIQLLKQSILTKSLGIYFNELKQLSQQNQLLRQKHRTIYEAKKPTLKGVKQIQIQSSPLQTPRSRRSIVNVYENENSFSKVYKNNILKPRQSDVGVLKPRKSYNNENQQNIKPMIYGRKSLRMSQAPLRQHDQLTERKMTNSVKFGMQVVCSNISTFSQCNSVKSSQKSRRGTLQLKEKDNIFVNFIELMLQQQMDKQKQIMKIFQQQKMSFHKGHQEIYINNLQKQVQSTTTNISKLQQILQNYELQIKKMQLNLTTVTDMTKQITKVKQTYMKMKQKCQNIQFLRVQVLQKQRKLKQLKENVKYQHFQIPNSIMMMLRLFGIQQNNLNNPSKCKQQIKKLVSGNLQKPNKKKLKIKQLLDTIRQGRKKFKQLMSVYEGRVKKLQRKLISLKGPDIRNAQQ